MNDSLRRRFEREVDFINNSSLPLSVRVAISGYTGERFVTFTATERKEYEDITIGYTKDYKQFLEYMDQAERELEILNVYDKTTLK